MGGLGGSRSFGIEASHLDVLIEFDLATFAVLTDNVDEVVCSS